MLAFCKNYSTTWLCALMVLISMLEIQAQPHYTPTDEVRHIYDLVTELRVEEARLQLEAARSKDKDNLLLLHLENYADFFSIFVSERKDLYREQKKLVDERLRALSKGDQSSPYHLYVAADIRLQWALLDLRFGELVSAFGRIRKANKLLNKNLERFPAFMPTRKDLAVLHAAVGTVPDQYQWALELLGGLEGTVEQGISEMELVLKSTKTDPGYLYRLESEVIYAFLLLHLADEQAAAWQIVQAANLSPRHNPLHTFVMANIAMRTGHNDVAVSILDNIPEAEEFVAFPYLHYMHGLARLRRLDTGSVTAFQRFLAQTNGDHYIKEAYQKMAWAALLEEDLPAYNRIIASCVHQGGAEAGGDKSAMDEALAGEPPHLDLLKARLLFDGGYYQKALELLQQFEASAFAEIDHQLEYTYRRGRVQHGLKNYAAALEDYTRTIARGKGHPAFFACNAALQSGQILEKQGRAEAARRAYELCLSMQPDSHAVGLHRQAKSGLSRLKGDR